MKIKKIDINNIKSFDNFQINDISQSINILIGHNNSGKSTVLHCIQHLMSDTSRLDAKNLRLRTSTGEIDIYLDTIDDKFINKTGSSGAGNPKKNENSEYQYRLNVRIVNNSIGNKFLYVENQDQIIFHSWYHDNFKNTFLVPFFSSRKVTNYSEKINSQSAMAISENLSNLYGIIDFLNTPQFEEHKNFHDSCKKILGFDVSSYPSSSGKIAGQIFNSEEFIPMTFMGDGVPNIVGLIAYLLLSKNKLFLIEEIENDVHPQALKKLIDLIIKSAEDNNNQFFVTTHSNIVLRYLGGYAESKIYHLSTDYTDIPKTQITNIKTEQERIDVLTELGYDLFDYNLFDAWFFFEESTAERLFREYFIPWYTPALNGKIRTISCGGTSDIEPRFIDFDRLFKFTHLTPIYKNKAWIFADGDISGVEALQNLKKVYIKSGWDTGNFINFDENNFEEYYPEPYKREFSKISMISDKQERRNAKKILFEKVIEYIKKDVLQAQKEFYSSAKEPIEHLKRIEQIINCA